MALAHVDPDSIPDPPVIRIAVGQRVLDALQAGRTLLDLAAEGGYSIAELTRWALAAARARARPERDVALAAGERDQRIVADPQPQMLPFHRLDAAPLPLPLVYRDHRTPTPPGFWGVQLVLPFPGWPVLAV